MQQKLAFRPGIIEALSTTMSAIHLSMTRIAEVPMWGMVGTGAPIMVVHGWTCDASAVLFIETKESPGGVEPVILIRWRDLSGADYRASRISRRWVIPWCLLAADHPRRLRLRDSLPDANTFDFGADSRLLRLPGWSRRRPEPASYLETNAAGANHCRCQSRARTSDGLPKAIFSGMVGGA
jgi:hypothetical protein